MGEPSEDFDPEIVGEAVRNDPSRFQRCFAVAKEKNPSLTGRIEVRFLVNTEGTIGQAMAADTNLPSVVASCVVNAFYDLKLPAQDSAVVAQYPMFFQPG